MATLDSLSTSLKKVKKEIDDCKEAAEELAIRLEELNKSYKKMPLWWRIKLWFAREQDD